jgi:hypothetical protein
MNQKDMRQCTRLNKQRSTRQKIKFSSSAAMQRIYSAIYDLVKFSLVGTKIQS